ncbi:MAG TPA: hypothetical protein PK095_21430 [Myxococcota bacterium]|nr:hypothetical protein [Myxococcota bacterium]
MRRQTLSAPLCLLALLACDDPTAQREAPDETSEVRPISKGDDPSATAFEGPRPDFDPALGVRSHILLRELAPDFVDSLREVLGRDSFELMVGNQGPSLGYSGRENLVWARDYLPLHLGRGANERVLAYLSVDPVRSAWTGASWVPAQAPSPDHQFYKSASGSGGRWLETTTMPLLFEGGNLVSTGAFVITTDRLITLNTTRSEGTDARHLRDAGWQLRDEAEVLELFTSYTRIPSERLIVIPSMPGEKTDHADLVVMALGPTEVMVPELRTDILDIITYGHEIELGQVVKDYLDEVADQLTERGLTVHRLPMLPPVFLEADTREPTGWNAVFYSPANALALDRGDDDRHLWLPAFTPTGFPDDYRAVADAYLAEQVAFFTSRDFEVHVVDATRLGRAYGLFRCVTSPAFVE